MSEGGESSNLQEIAIQSPDQNPNQYRNEHTERPVEDYSLLFGDVITFSDKTDPNTKRSVIVDVKEPKSPDFTVLHITKKDDGQDMILVGAPSTHGVEQQFYVLEKWSTDKIKEALKNSFENDRNIALHDPKLSETDKDKRINLIKLLEDKALTRVDKWAQNQSRLVTQEEIKEGKRKKV
ncbi:MAG TPA: hypothetical protein PLS49_06990 [Candidatus Woesebacteria bacterium]|nr:hypothetical protein [Candidatus Woesebacteria bacterium]